MKFGVIAMKISWGVIAMKPGVIAMKPLFSTIRKMSDTESLERHGQPSYKVDTIRLVGV